LPNPDTNFDPKKADAKIPVTAAKISINAVAWNHCPNFNT